MKITNLEILRSEKVRLQNESEALSQFLKDDVDVLKQAIQPWALIHRAVSALIPEVLKKSKITSIPINFLLKTVFGEKPSTVKVDPVTKKRNQIKNIALSVLESTAMVLLTRGIKKGF